MFAILGALLAIWLVVWLVRRRTRPPVQEPYAFTRAEIASYDTALPKYLLAAATSLLAGGIHGLLVQLPPVRRWLALAGAEPARLMVDAVSEQLLIVGGVVMLVMGLTCYALPRLIGRPLRNHNLARLSFLLTAAGTGLTALVSGTIGLLQGIYVHGGGSYASAQAWLGLWERFPLWLFEGARDAGYWTFALLVLLTVLSSRNVIWPRHRRRLTVWLVVAAVALFLAVWQRVFDAMPQSRLWLAAGEAAVLLDYQGYSHLHLYVGVLVPLAAATFVYLLERKAERRIEWRTAAQTLAGLALAGSAFYAVRLGLSLYEGYLVVARRLSPGAAAASWEPYRSALLGLTGVGMLAALLAYLVYAIGLARAARGYLPRAIVGTLSASLAVAFVGGLHGAVLALLPEAGQGAGTAAHGTLSVGALLLLPALTLADSLLIDASGAGRTANLCHAGLGFLGSGIVLAYLGRLGLGGPAAALAAAGLQCAGFLAFALHTYEATHTYRSYLPARLHVLRPRDGRPSRLALLELPLSQVLLIEFLAGLAGFPGLGWLFAGHSLTGALLLYVGPCLAWALLPSLFALSGGWLHHAGWNLLVFLYLPASALLSTVALRDADGRRAAAPQVGGGRDEEGSQPAVGGADAEAPEAP